jgi:hypothetical protein
MNAGGVVGVFFLIHVSSFAQALQYFARESVFVVCVSDGNEDSDQLSETRYHAQQLCSVYGLLFSRPCACSFRCWFLNFAQNRVIRPRLPHHMCSAWNLRARQLSKLRCATHQYISCLAMRGCLVLIQDLVQTDSIVVWCAALLRSHPARSRRCALGV